MVLKCKLPDRIWVTGSNPATWITNIFICQPIVLKFKIQGDISFLINIWACNVKIWQA